MNPLVAAAFSSWAAAAAKVRAAERDWERAVEGLRAEHPTEPLSARLKDADRAQAAYYSALSSYFAHAEDHRRFLADDAARAA